MPAFGPISRRRLIRALKDFGFDGPFSGANHAFMERGDLRLRIPNEHNKDIGPALLNQLLHQAGISRDEWEQI
ncbi:MAG: type II toxin-antitoxin system HicA family toxin [Thermomicrobiales bacterium]